MSTLVYEIVDVFTDRPFAGNPLAVVFGAEELATAQLQALAREFNLSETVFVLPPTAGTGAGYRARIFTPIRELPFAGHPSIGAAVTGVRRGLFPAGPVVQECGAGLLPIDASRPDAARLTGGTPTLGAELDPARLRGLLELGPDDLTGATPRRAGCGLEFGYVAVTADALGRVRPDPARLLDADLGFLSVLHWDPATATARARVFCPAAGIPEDPATGSAALGLGAWLVGVGLLPGDGESAYTVRQGVEIQRPSTLHGSVTAADGAALEATVAGSVVPIARGEIAVPPFVG
ncbi:MAG TPA: PhzF family phenazine biosynthesis protein [Pilimelia sp.]|nr:PhzF family phenazine biosynthesis protein [Pilimelia sp.]